MSAGQQNGYILLPVVLLITLISVVAFLLNHESALGTGTTGSLAEAEQAEQVAHAGLAHAQWWSQTNGCLGDQTMTTVPFGPSGAPHSYTATVTSPGGTNTPNALSADQDAWFRSDDITRNNGTTATYHLRMEFGNLEYTVVRFDLSTLPAGAHIQSATARFYVKATKGHPEGPVTVHRVTADWTETGATWETMSSNFDSTLLNMIPPQPDAGDNWVQVNLTAQVQAWVNGEPNYGVMLIPTGEGTHAEYISREGAASQRPRLDVVVGTGPASPVTITATGTLDSGVSRILTRTVPAYQPASYTSLQLEAGAGKDAMLSGFYDTKNYGDHRLRVSSAAGSPRNSLVQFDVPAVPAGARVLSAQLQLYHSATTTAAADAGVTVHRVRRDWVEGTKSGSGTADGATWLTWNGSNAWTTAGGDYDPAAVASSPITAATGDWESWDIKALAQGWLDGTFANSGMLLKASGDVNIDFASKEDADPAIHPKLTLTYACECGVACLAPQGSGRIALIGDDSSPDPDDQLKIEIIESWGYEVDFFQDQDSDTINWSNYDLAYVSETVISGDVSANLTNRSIGVVNEEPKLYDDLQLANGDTEHVGSSIDIIDNSHYISSIFPQGALSIYDGDMEILTADTPLAAGLQTLGEYSGAASLTALDQGAPTTSGTAAGRRVTLPLGQHFASNFTWTQLNNNGRLLVQRAIQWGTGNTGPLVSDPIILSTDSAATLGGLNFDDIDLAEYDPPGDSASLYFEGAPTTLTVDIDALHVLANGHIVLSTKDAATLGGLSFADGDLVDYDPVTDTAVLFFEETAFSADEDIRSVYLMDNGHILLSTDSGATLGGLSFTDKDLVEYDPGSDTATLYFDGSTTSMNSDIDALHLLDNGHILLSTKDDATLGGLSFSDGDLIEYDAATDTAARYFDEARFAGDEDVISVHIGAGSGSTSSPPVGNRLLLVVVDPSSLTAQEAAKKTLIESWGYTVTLIDESDPQADFDAALAVNDVAYISGDVDASVLGTKLTATSVGVVNEQIALHDELGFSSSAGSNDFDKISVVDNTHSITDGYTTGWLTIATSSQTLNALEGTVATGLQNLAEVWISGANYKDGLAVLDTGAQLYGGGAAAGRRAQLPWGVTGFDFTALNDNGETIMQRAIEWAVGGAGGVANYTVLMVVGNATTLASKDVGYKALIESWGHTVTLIDDGDSQTNFNTAMAAADVVYVSGTSSGPALLDKVTGTTTGVVNEINGKLDNFGFSSSTSSTVNTDTFSTTDAAHYITEPFSGNPVTVFTASLTSPVPGGTLAPDLQIAGEVSGTPALVTLDTGATRWDSNPAPARRVHLPFASAETTDLTGDGETILQRALEWGAGNGGGGGGGGGDCDGTFRDEFNDRNWSGSDGTLDWSASPWAEVGESDGPTGGDVRVSNDTSNYQLAIQDNQNGGEGVERTADLTGAVTATLSLDYRRNGLDNANDYVAVYASSTGTAGPWTELTRFQGSGTDSTYQPYSTVISAYISANTAIRLRSSSTNGNTDRVWFDNIQIQCSP